MSSDVLAAERPSPLMATITESTAVTTVISQTGSEVIRVNTEQLLNQARSQAAMNMAKELLESGIITKEEYAEIDTIMTGKYEPFFGTLFSEIDLINTAD